MFENCAKLKSVNLSNVAEIASSAFEGCSSLTTVTFGSKLVKIDTNAFKDTALTAVNLPSSVTTIGSSAFKNAKLKTLVLPSKLTSLGSSAFRDNTNLTSVTFGNLLAEVPGYCFSGCSALKTVSLGSGITKINSGVFEDCVSLSSINIPDTMTEIGSFAFEGCVSLTYLKLGNAIKKIDSYAFDDCSRLQTLYLPYGVTEIGSASSVLHGVNGVTVHVYKGTYGETWAKENKVNYVTETFAPNPVQKLKAVSAGKNKVKLTWQKTAYTDGYLIYALKNNKYGYVGQTTYTSYTDTKALSGGYNFYYVYAYKKGSNGKKIIGKAPAYVYAKGVCAAVTNLKAAGVKGGVKVTFKKSADAAGYYVYKKVGNGKFTYIGYTTSNTYIDKKASKTQYSFYRVVPYHKNGSKKVMGQLGTYVYAKAK